MWLTVQCTYIQIMCYSLLLNPGRNCRYVWHNHYHFSPTCHSLLWHLLSYKAEIFSLRESFSCSISKFLSLACLNFFSSICMADFSITYSASSLEFWLEWKRIGPNLLQEVQKVYLLHTIPKPRGIPPSVCSDTPNLWKLQKAEPARCLALRTKGW